MKSFARATFALLAIALLSVVTAESRAQDPDSVPPRTARFTTEQLDSLLAPIALYPDPLLAQVLVAATFADQIEEAAAYVRTNGTEGIDEQGWDVSVKAVAHYPPVLNRMVERIDWTTELGQAYALQSTDVMDAVQRLRAQAAVHGNLQSTAEQEVTHQGKHIVITPAQPTVVYVPTYDPAIVYFQPVFVVAKHHARYWSFGIGFPIGAWLNYDCDWYGRRIYYHGWRGYGWHGRSRPHIRLSHHYVHPRFVGVHANRRVLYRPVRAETHPSTGAPNRTVFSQTVRSGANIYVSDGPAKASSNSRTVFPRDLRGALPPSKGSAREAGKSATTREPIVYRGSVPSNRTQAPGSGYGSVRRPSQSRPVPAGVSGGSYGTVRSRPGTTKSTGSSVAPAPTRPSGGFGTVRPPRASSGARPSSVRPPSSGSYQGVQRGTTSKPSSGTTSRRKP